MTSLAEIMPSKLSTGRLKRLCSTGTQMEANPRQNFKTFWSSLLATHMSQPETEPALKSRYRSNRTLRLRHQADAQACDRPAELGRRQPRCIGRVPKRISKFAIMASPGLGRGQLGVNRAVSGAP